MHQMAFPRGPNLHVGQVRVARDILGMRCDRIWSVAVGRGNSEEELRRWTRCRMATILRQMRQTRCLKSPFLFILRFFKNIIEYYAQDTDYNRKSSGYAGCSMVSGVFVWRHSLLRCGRKDSTCFGLNGNDNRICNCGEKERLWCQRSANRQLRKSSLRT